MLGENDRQVEVVEWADRRLTTQNNRLVKYLGKRRFLLLGQTPEMLRLGPDGRGPDEPEGFVA
jgi:hypothetical protein